MATNQPYECLGRGKEPPNPDTHMCNSQSPSFCKAFSQRFCNNRVSGHALSAHRDVPGASFSAVNFQDMAPLNISVSPRVNGKWQEALII